jgi:cytochrome P450
LIGRHRARSTTLAAFAQGGLKPAVDPLIQPGSTVQTGGASSAFVEIALKKNEIALRVDAVDAGFVPSCDPLMPHPVHVMDPYKVYAELRTNAPMYRSPHGVWIASAHREVSFMFKDARFGRGYYYFENMIERHGPSMMDNPIYGSARNMMLMKDDEDHQRIRQLVMKAFTHKRIDTLREFIRDHTNRLVDAAIAKRDVDMMEDIAFPLPGAVICHLLGVPESDWHKFSKRSENGTRALEPSPLNSVEICQQNQSVTDFRDYFQWLAELRKREPGDDLTSMLVAAEDHEGGVSRMETLDNLRMMFVAGQETTVNTIGNGLLALYRNPEQLNLLKGNSGLLPQAVLEMIRYDSAVQMTTRQAREDVDMGDVRIGRGETVLCIIASANRDEAAWADADKFEIARERKFPMSFGGGPHYCTGAQLAKVEAEIAFETILARMPGLKLDVENPQWLPNTVVFRGLKALSAAI